MRTSVPGTESVRKAHPTDPTDRPTSTSPALHFSRASDDRRRGCVTTIRKVGNMNAVKMIAMALILGGALALMYGGFSYTRETQQVKLGPIELSVKEKQTVNIPVWAGVGAMLIGGALFLFGSKKD